MTARFSQESHESLYSILVPWCRARLQKWSQCVKRRTNKSQRRPLPCPALVPLQDGERRSPRRAEVRMLHPVHWPLLYLSMWMRSSRMARSLKISHLACRQREHARAEVPQKSHQIRKAPGHRQVRQLPRKRSRAASAVPPKRPLRRWHLLH